MSKRGTERGATGPGKGAGGPARASGGPAKSPGGAGGTGGAGGARKGPGGAGAGKKVTGSARKAAARRRREQRRRAVIAVVVAAVVVVGVVVAVVATRKPAAAGYARVTTFGGLSRNHTSAAVHYAQTPPVGGDHNPVWQNCGYYDQPLHNENAVHSLEHGAVWVTYRPNLPKDQVDRLANLARGQTFVLASPYPGLPAPVVASAWGVQEWFHTANDPKLNDFVSKYRQGPQTPEPGAACTNGTGTPE